MERSPTSRRGAVQMSGLSERIDRDPLASLPLFQGLTVEQRSAVVALMRRRDLLRGHVLVAEGERSDAMFVVLHGAFEVARRDNPSTIAELRAGEVIGEIGFFARMPRTATVRALRDAAVLELTRAAYEQIAREAPSIVEALLAALAHRLDETTARLPVSRRRQAERTIALVHAGHEPVPRELFARLRTALTEVGARVIDRQAMRDRFGSLEPPAADVSHWLDALEWEGQLVYFADPDLTDWTRKCVRQADTVVLVTRGEAPAAESTPTEEFVCAVHDSATRRLVRVHDRRQPVVSGTSTWLRRVPVFLHHHVALEDDLDIRSLARFLTGRALGLVAGGGGGFGPAHGGIYKAFGEHGVTFDVFIGTSVGAAMAAGFALLMDADEVDARTHEIFVTRRSFKRPTWPRYALLDHQAFDKALAHAYGSETRIEDCWRPFFAVATNLSTQRPELIKSGLLWKAVRASSAIPAVLPPVFTEDGAMMVDGCVMDNAPLAPLKEIKLGPNLVVHFGRTGEQRFDCRYEDIPGRGKLLAHLLNPFARRRLPRVPRPVNVLWRSLLAHQRYDLPLEPHDLVLRPPRLPGASFMSFDEHRSVFEAAHTWAQGKIRDLSRSGDVALAAILATARGAAPPVP